MAETELKNEEVFKHFNEVRRDSCKIASVKDLLEDHKREKIFAIKRLDGKAIVLKPLGELDKQKIYITYRDEIKVFEKNAIEIRKILTKKSEDRTLEENDKIISMMNTNTTDYDVALINAIIKEPEMTLKGTKDFLNSLTSEEYNEFMNIALPLYEIKEEEIEKLKNL